MSGLVILSKYMINWIEFGLNFDWISMRGQSFWREIPCSIALGVNFLGPTVGSNPQARINPTYTGVWGNLMEKKSIW